MTEPRPNQNRQIIEKLDAIDRKVTRIEAQIEYQPKIDAETHKAIDERFCVNESAIHKLEANQRWLVMSILSSIILAAMQLILR